MRTIRLVAELETDLPDNELDRLVEGTTEEDLNEPADPYTVHIKSSYWESIEE